MTHRAILDDLLEVLSNRGVHIRTDCLGGGGGGLCQLRDKTVFFLDSQASSYDSAIQAGRAVLRVVEDPETIFLKPAVRDFLDRIQEMG